VSYTNDNLGRLTDATEGTWGGSSISSETRKQTWTLDQVGNWDHAQLDLDGNNNYSDTGNGEYDDARTHDIVNQLTGRNTDNTGGDEFTLTYDAVGNMTSDGADTYIYDAFGRLVTVKDASSNTLADYTYNGLGFRKSYHEDENASGVADGSDPTYQLIYDERWRLIAVYRDDDDNPKELFAHHQAGLDGAGGSSYIDSVILRQRDHNSGWTSAADGTLEQRRYYCQNWRADVSAIVTSAGVMVEWDKFSAYGIPFGLPAGDTNSDGDCDSSDETAIHVWAVGYDVRYDYDLDGDIDGDDETLANANNASTGWNALSSAAVANRVSYAGYQKASHLDLNHVRHRVYSTELGRWTRRDSMEILAGPNYYAYAYGVPASSTDALGLLPSYNMLGGAHAVTASSHSFTALTSWLIVPYSGSWPCGTDTSGWLVQEVIFQGGAYDIQTRASIRDYAAIIPPFLEARPILRPDIAISFSMLQPYMPFRTILTVQPSDASQLRDYFLDPAAGHIDSGANVKFFCKSSISGDTPEGWSRDMKHPSHGGLYHLRPFPSWWGTSSPIWRFHTVDFWLNSPSDFSARSVASPYWPGFHWCETSDTLHPKCGGT